MLRWRKGNDDVRHCVSRGVRGPKFRGVTFQNFIHTTSIKITIFSY